MNADHTPIEDDAVRGIRWLMLVLGGLTIIFAFEMLLYTKYETPSSAQIQTTIGQGCFKEFRERRVRRRLIARYGEPGRGCSAEAERGSLFQHSWTFFFVDDYWYDCPLEASTPLPCRMTTDLASWLERYRSRVHWIPHEGRRRLLGLDFLDQHGRVVGRFGTPAAFDAHYRALQSNYLHNQITAISVTGAVTFLLFLLQFLPVPTSKNSA